MKHTIGVLALQGGFASHRTVLECLGQKTVEVRTVDDLSRCDGLVMPGGESTVLTKLLMRPESGPAFGKPWEPGPLFLAIREFAKTKPVMGTCAGLIMLARPCGDERVFSLDVLPVSVERNAYGRQTESFIELIELALPAPGDKGEYRATFIRAPKIAEIGAGVEILARARGKTGEPYPVMVRRGKILGLTFHPELTPADPRIHGYFLSLF